MSEVSVENRIKVLEGKIKDFISSKGNLLGSEYAEIIDEYDEITLELINQDDLPDCVSKFISNEYGADSNLPEKYSGLTSVRKLGEYAYKTATKEIKKSIKSDSYGVGIKYFTKAFSANPANVSLLYLYENKFKKLKIYSELLELYKAVFAHTYDPVSCEKMGDIYMILKDYDKSVEYYLNYAELTEENSKIYLKLANAFEKLGDKDSYNACIEQAKRIEESNE